MTQVFHLSFRWNSFSSPCWYQSNLLVPLVAKISPHSFEMFFHKPTTNLFVLLLVFPNNSVLTFLEGCLPRSFVAEVVIFFSIPSFSFIYRLFLSSGGIVMLLSSTHHLVLSRSCSFLCLSIQPECRALFSSSSHFVKFYLPSQPECCLKSFLPIVPFFQ